MLFRSMRMSIDGRLNKEMTYCAFLQGSMECGRATIWSRRIQARHYMVVRFLILTGDNSAAPFTKPGPQPAVIMNPAHRSSVLNLTNKEKRSEGNPPVRNCRKLFSHMIISTLLIVFSVFSSAVFAAEHNSTALAQRQTLTHGE